MAKQRAQNRGGGKSVGGRRNGGGSAAAAAAAQSRHMEIVHHPDYNRAHFMPYVPAIKIKSGKILWLAGTTALPVYHDHPHRREDIIKFLPNDLEAQTRAAMEGVEQTLEAAGATFKDGGHILCFA